MRTKDMNKEQAIQTIELLKKRIAFNNRLNKVARKFMREKNIVGFNGFWDEPTPEMVQIMKDELAKEDWMEDSLKKQYLEYTNACFGGVYGPHVNTYVLNDLHDTEKHLANLEAAENRQEEDQEIGDEIFKVERDLDHNRLNLYFDYIPSEEVRSLLKHYGFKWSRYLEAWTRQLTDQAERSLERLKREISELNKGE